LPNLTNFIKVALVGILGALLLVSVLSTQKITINALDFSIGLHVFDKGYTAIDIPPLGTIRARTHQLPLMFRISLQNINLERLSDLVTAQDPELIFEEIQDTLRHQAIGFLLRTLAVSFVGGFGAAFLLFREGKKALFAGIAGLLAFSILIGSALLTYDEKAFREPEFEGIVEAAPWLMGVAEEALVAVQGLDEKMKIVTDNLLVLFESLRYLGGGGGSVDGELKVLHISDIHNNPIGVSLAKQMAVSFGVDLIIDTGDLTDYGTPLEADLISGIEEINLPWLFVPGNHDSPSVIQSFQELDNVIVIEEGVIYLEELDIAIAGAADPSSQTSAMTVAPRDVYKEAAARLRDKISQADIAPSIIVGHHAYLLDELSDLYAVMLHGHSHRVSIQVKENALVVDAGTTGGAGIRGLMTPNEMPFTMVLLHFNRRNAGWYAAAADVITVHQLDAGFILERHLLRQPSPPVPLEEQEGLEDSDQDEDSQPGEDE